MRRKLLVTVLAGAALLVGSAGAATAAPTPPPAAANGLTTAAVAASLHGDALAKWKSLPEAKKQLTVKILSEKSFGLPAEAAALQEKYPELQVSESQGTDVDSSALTATKTSATTALAAATTGRTSWVSQNWTILGITYCSVKTTIGYETSGGVVRSVNRCYGTSVNYVPLRSINSNSWYTLGNGLADCWTEWTLGRPLQSDVTGIQGLRVNGYGTIIKRWNV